LPVRELTAKQEAGWGSPRTLFGLLSSSETSVFGDIIELREPVLTLRDRLSVAA